MLLGLLLGLPLWVTCLGYIGIGLAWAVAYLPHGIAKQARNYREWKTSYLEGMTLDGFLNFQTTATQPDGKGSLKERKAPVQPYKQGQSFLRHRDASSVGKSPMRDIMVRFILNIAFWPFSILDSTLRGLIPFIKRVFRALGRFLRNVFQYVWDLLLPVLRAARRLIHWVYRAMRDFWGVVLEPALTWAYRKLQGRYRAIIAWANREAIADLEAFNKPTAKDPSK